MKKIAVPHSAGKLVAHCFQIDLEFGSVDFCGGRKTGETEEKPFEARTRPEPNTRSPRFRTQATLVGGELRHTRLCLRR